MSSSAGRFTITVGTMLLFVMSFVQMDFTTALLTTGIITVAYFLLGWLFGILGTGYGWVVQMKAWEIAGIQRFGRELTWSGPGGLVLLVPIITTVVAVDIREDAFRLGPIESTTADTVEVDEVVGVASMRVRRVKKNEQDEIPTLIRVADLRQIVYGSTPAALHALKNDTLLGLLRQNVGSNRFQELLKADTQIQVPDHIQSRARSIGREVLAVMLGRINMPNDLREEMAQGAEHRIEAGGLRELKDLLEELKDQPGVMNALIELRRARAMESMADHEKGASPVIFAGMGNSADNEKTLALLSAVLQKNEGGK